MADVIRKATNKFTKGLVMDFSPENTGNEVLTHALNATLLTFNGNELSLQNDQGNARVETAYLPEGYIPVGTCEYGGIIYIVSYNPLEDKSQIGCFPSPERNISSDELGKQTNPITRDDFQEKDSFGDLTGKIEHTSKLVLLKDDKLNPGDKFIVCAENNIYNEKLQDLLVKHEGDDFIQVMNPIIALNVVSIEDSGKIIYLNSALRQYDCDNSYVDSNGVQHTDTYKYHILGKMVDGKPSINDIDSYRNTLSSGYSIFKSKTSGKLAILAELIMIDSYDVTHSIEPRLENGQETGKYDLIIHTEVSPKVTTNNYTQVPKLKYYYLDKSQGWLQVADSVQQLGDQEFYPGFYKRPLFTDNGSVNKSFMNTPLNNIYTSNDPVINSTKLLEDTGEFNFTAPGSYCGKLEDTSGNLVEGIGNSELYTKFTEGQYHKIIKSQVLPDGKTFNEFKNFYLHKLNAKFYKYTSTSNKYTEYTETELDELKDYYIKKEIETYEDVRRRDSYKHKKILYKLAPAETVEATSTQKQDASIEKWYEKEVKFWKALTSDEAKTVSDPLYFLNSEGKYESIGGNAIEDGKTYYIEASEKILVSVGYVLTQEWQKQTLYYIPVSTDYIEATPEDIDMYWNTTSYPIDPNDTLTLGAPIILYDKKQDYEYVKATEQEKQKWKEDNLTFYYYAEYEEVNETSLKLDTEEQLEPLFISVPIDTYVHQNDFMPNSEVNYIAGYDYGSGNSRPWADDTYPKDDPIHVYKISDFIPHNIESEKETEIEYDDVRLATIKIPGAFVIQNLDLPFKYDYTIVPCMNYGKLNHLAVSNTVDFSNLHQFENSNFTTWKYHIDGSQLRLTFGADIYDTFQQDKVDALIVEFYDLWGFAGSLEIQGKKSYSGVFNKIVNLDTIGALHTQKVTESGEYTHDYSRSINIQEIKNSGYYIGDQKVIFKGSDYGWFYADDTPIEAELNDCGALYSNMLYGVKTYIRTTNGSGIHTFHPKKQFFLYTMPIFNDYYYVRDDFSTLGRPELDLVLTYRLQDNSTIQPYTQDSIVNGYNTEIQAGDLVSDKDKIDAYLSGQCEYSTINVTRYYKYKGQSQLSLEVGLKQDYGNFGLMDDRDELNKLFSCQLKLVGDNINNSLSIEKHSDNKEQILNYNEWTFDQKNFIKFSTGNEIHITKDFQQYNFTQETRSYLPLEYEFIVGYKASITNITTTAVKAITVSALCHSTNGVYNYEDFNVYENEGTLYSSTVFFNGGDVKTSVFGVARQLSKSGNAAEQCSEITSIDTEVSKISIPGKLNAGDPLKQLSSYIGKLSFCQPHLNAINDINGVNLHENFSIPTGVGGGKDDDGKKWPVDPTNSPKAGPDETYGIIPTNKLYTEPLYSMNVNTKNSIQYYGEFISTIMYKKLGVSMVLHANISKDIIDSNDVPTPERTGNRDLVAFTGLTGTQLVDFNTTLIKSMKSVYAYNPDYDTLIVNKGSVSIDTNPLSFISNIISYNSSLDLSNKSFNDLIGIRGIQVSKYLQLMNRYSGKENTSIVIEEIESGVTKTLDCVNFKPGYTYCGTDTNDYLVTSLTYKTSVPESYSDELLLKANDQVVVNHHDGSRTFLHGQVDKKKLYGYCNDSLVELDISNYIINEDGSLEIATQEKQMSSDLATSNFTGTNIKDLLTNKVTYKKQIQDDYAICDLSIEGDKSYWLSNGWDGNYNYVFFAADPNQDITLKCIVKAISDNGNYVYNAKVNQFKINVEYRLVQVPEEGYNDTTIQELKKLTFGQLNELANTGKLGNDDWKYQFEKDTSAVAALRLINDPSDINSIRMYDGNTDGDLDVYWDCYALYKISITPIVIGIDQYTNNYFNSGGITTSVVTTDYADIVNNQYVIDSKYKNACFRGTSMTINDLIYEPVVEGHRLYVKPINLQFCSKYYPVLYYRTLDIDKTNTDTSWAYLDTKYKNCLFLYTGPSFDASNL